MENSAFGFHDGEAFSFLGKQETGGRGFDVRSILESKDAAVWIAGNADTARITRDGLYQAISHATDSQRFNTVGAFQDSQGRVWLGTANQGVLYWQAGTIAKLPDPTVGSLVVHCFAEDADGQIFIGTQSGLFRYATNLEQQESYLVGDDIRALLTDRHGALWIGTTGNGLFRLLNGELSSIRNTDGLAGGAVRALAQDREGSIWVGTTEGLSQVTDVKFPTQPVVDDSHVRPVIAVGASPRGGIWAAHNEGVTYIDGRTAPKLYSTESGLSAASFKRVFEASNGDVYIVGGSSTLMVLSGGKVVAEHQADNLVVGMAEDAPGVVVSGGGTLFRAGTGNLTPYPFQ
ncbi:MAG TPA: two-component regulator propeller domain-containing protein, partial [Opitutaceae bacterium]|nr:two-component regulator propeller domain-containing protein [Opitutaceae bacterium]